ncbi:hypothetical protein ACFQL4_25635 [Halosimplex aquaticum]
MDTAAHLETRIHSIHSRYRACTATINSSQEFTILPPRTCNGITEYEQRRNERPEDGLEPPNQTATNSSETPNATKTDIVVISRFVS